MTRITTRTHGIIDWAAGLCLTLFPMLFIGDVGGVVQGEALGIAPYVGQAALWSVVAAGVLFLANTIATDYEMGIRPIVPMSAHLVFDMLIGLLLAASPWLLGFSVYIAWPHVLFGGGAIVLALFTRRHTSYAY